MEDFDGFGVDKPYERFVGFKSTLDKDELKLADAGTSISISLPNSESESKDPPIPEAKVAEVTRRKIMQEQSDLPESKVQEEKKGSPVKVAPALSEPASSAVVSEPEAAETDKQVDEAENVQEVQAAVKEGATVLATSITSIASIDDSASPVACELCDEAVAVLKCEQCDLHLCEVNQCDQDMHQNKLAHHKRTRIEGPKPLFVSQTIAKPVSKEASLTKIATPAAEPESVIQEIADGEESASSVEQSSVSKLQQEQEKSTPSADTVPVPLAAGEVQTPAKLADSVDIGARKRVQESDVQEASAITTEDSQADVSAKEKTVAEIEEKAPANDIFASPTKTKSEESSLTHEDSSPVKKYVFIDRSWDKGSPKKSARNRTEKVGNPIPGPNEAKTEKVSAAVVKSVESLDEPGAENQVEEKVESSQTNPEKTVKTTETKDENNSQPPLDLPLDSEKGFDDLDVRSSTDSVSANFYCKACPCDT